MPELAREREEMDPLEPPSMPPSGINPSFRELKEGDRLRRIYVPTPLIPPNRPRCPSYHVCGGDPPCVYTDLCTSEPACPVQPATGLTFNDCGQLSRFDHHVVPCPRRDRERRVYYASEQFGTCVNEVFGKHKQIRMKGYRFAVVEVTTSLALLDLAGDGAYRAGIDPGLVKKERERSLTQMWARYFYKFEAVFAQGGRAIDGLVYNNVADGSVVVLFERAEQALVEVGDCDLARYAARLTRFREMWRDFGEE